MDYTIFIRDYEKVNNKTDFVSKHITKKYLSYSAKMAIANNIARIASHVIDKNGNVGIYKRDTMAQYFHVQMNIIQQYTDIDIPSELVVNAYDKLSETGALSEILHQVPDSEREMIKSMTQMAMDDTYINEVDAGVVLSTKLEALRLIADTAMSALEEVAKNQSIDTHEIKAALSGNFKDTVINAYQNATTRDKTGDKTGK